MNLRLLMKSSEKLIVDNSPVILTGVAVVGTISTAYLAARASFKAVKIIEDKEVNGGLKWAEMAKPELTMSRVKLVWPQYLPAAGSAAATIACIVCANHISTKRVAAMAAAYSLSEKKLTEYKDKIAEKLGLEEKEEIDKEVNRSRVKNTRGSDAIILGGDDVLCFDAYSGRYFKSSMESLRGAMNDTNFDVIHDNYATLTNFWDRIGLEATAYSEEFGWTADCPLELQFSTTMSSDDRPCMVVSYDVEPVRRWNHL